MALLPDNLNLPQPRCSVTESTVAGTRSLVLDNGTLRLSLLPEYGARLCSLFYRPLNLELLATEFLRDMYRGLHVHGGWCAAFPSLLADGEVISRAVWETAVEDLSDDALTLRAWCYVDRVSHKLEDKVRLTQGTILVERFIRMSAGQPVVIIEDVLTNRNIWPLPTTWSGMIALRAQAGDRAVLPIDAVEIQRGVGPSGNELDFGLLVSTPFQAIARNLHEGWIGFRCATSPVDLKLSFPRELLPHAVIAAQRDDAKPAENSFRFQPLATPKPMADDTRGGALILPPKRPVSLPLRLEIGAGIITGGDWSRPGLQLAEIIGAQHVSPGRVALWRVGKSSMVVKTHRYLALLMPEFDEDNPLTPFDLPHADLILCADTPPREVLAQLAQRTSSRFIGPPQLRQALLDEGFGEDRSVALSPGARFDLPGFGTLAMPARGERPGEQLGFLVQLDHLLLYHTGPTGFLGEFKVVGETFHPQLVFLPLGPEITLADAVQAGKLLNPRQLVPLGQDEDEQELADRCRAQHLAFPVRPFYSAEGAFFDGYRLSPLA